MGSSSPSSAPPAAGGKPRQDAVITKLESKRYSFLVDGSMPVLDFDVRSGKEGGEGGHHLTLELFNPLSGEAFEAKFQRGRLEVDLDGSITYFSQSAEAVSASLFLGHSVIVTLNRKTGEVLIKTPSKIASVERSQAAAGSARAAKGKRGGEAPAPVESAWVKLKLE